MRFSSTRFALVSAVMFWCLSATPAAADSCLDLAKAAYKKDIKRIEKQLQLGADPNCIADPTKIGKGAGSLGSISLGLVLSNADIDNRKQLARIQQSLDLLFKAGAEPNRCSRCLYEITRNIATLITSNRKCGKAACWLTWHDFSRRFYENGASPNLLLSVPGTDSRLLLAHWVLDHAFLHKNSQPNPGGVPWKDSHFAAALLEPVIYRLESSPSQVNLIHPYQGPKRRTIQQGENLYQAMVRMDMLSGELKQKVDAAYRVQKDRFDRMQKLAELGPIRVNALVAPLVRQAEIARKLGKDSQLPVEIKRDKYTLQLTNALKNEDRHRALELFDLVDQFGGASDPAALFFHGEALAENGEYELAGQKLMQYCDQLGTDAPRYIDALTLALEVQTQQYRNEIGTAEALSGLAGDADRPTLGIVFAMLDDETEQALDITSGALIHYVMRGGAASSAGLEPGDIILSVNNLQLTDQAMLPQAISQSVVGSSVPMRVYSKGEKRYVTAVLTATKNTSMWIEGPIEEYFAQQDQGFPLELLINKYTVGVSSALQSAITQDALVYFNRLQVLTPELDDSLQFYYAETLLKDGQRTLGMEKLHAYLRTQGQAAKHYTQALQLLSQYD